MRPLVAVLLLCGAGCSRYHMYKKAGQAMVGAFQAQAAGTNAPRPRGLDGEEASLVIQQQTQGFSQGDNAPPAAPPSVGGAGVKPSGLSLQAR